MPKLIENPTVIAAGGNKPKKIREYVGRVNDGTEALSIAHMESLPGWAETGQRPDFDEYTVVLEGSLQVVHEQGTLEVAAGQAIIARAGEWVQYSTPNGARYLAVCLPAFALGMGHRDQ